MRNDVVEISYESPLSDEVRINCKGKIIRVNNYSGFKEYGIEISKIDDESKKNQNMIIEQLENNINYFYKKVNNKQAHHRIAFKVRDR